MVASLWGIDITGSQWQIGQCYCSIDEVSDQFRKLSRDLIGSERSVSAGVWRLLYSLLIYISRYYYLSFQLKVKIMK